MAREKKPGKITMMHMREERILNFAITNAQQIIGELHMSNGDVGEDVEVLEGLIEKWEHFAYIERMEAQTSSG